MARGFTLFELVVSLSILLALSALVFPAVSRRIAGSTGEAVSREIRAGVSDVRSRAIGESRAMRVEIERHPARGTVRLVVRAFAGEATTPSRPFVGPVFDEPEVSASAEAEATTVVELPRGTGVSRTAPVPSEERVAGVDEGEMAWEGEGVDSPTSAAVCLGVLLPTGGAVAGSAVYLELPGSWTLVVTIDPWTGAAVVTRWQEPALDEMWPGDEDGPVPGGGREEGARR